MVADLACTSVTNELVSQNAKVDGEKNVLASDAAGTDLRSLTPLSFSQLDPWHISYGDRRDCAI